MLIKEAVQRVVCTHQFSARGLLCLGNDRALKARRAAPAVPCAAEETPKAEDVGGP